TAHGQRARPDDVDRGKTIVGEGTAEVEQGGGVGSGQVVAQVQVQGCAVKRAVDGADASSGCWAVDLQAGAGGHDERLIARQGRAQGQGARLRQQGAGAQ